MPQTETEENDEDNEWVQKCLDCGNTTAFIHKVTGTETRIFRDGEFDHVEGDRDLYTEQLWCRECDSENVITQ